MEGTATSRLTGTVFGTAEQVAQLGGTGIPVALDAADDARRAALIARIRTESGRLDVLVNSAWGGYERFTGGSTLNPGPFGSSRSSSGTPCVGLGCGPTSSRPP